MALTLGQPVDEEERRRQAAMGLLSASAPASSGDPGGSIGGLTNPFGTVAQVPMATVGTVGDAGAGLNFNSKYAAQNEGITQGVINQQYQQNDALVGLDAQYQRNLSDAQTTAQQARSMLASRMAGRGISNSGIAAGAVGKQEQSQAQYQADLANQLAGQKSQVQAGFVNNVNSLYQQRAGMYGQQVQEEAAAAEEQARQTAAAQAQATAQAQQQELLAQQQAAYQQQQQQQAQLMAAISAPTYSAGGIGGGYGGGGGGAQPGGSGPVAANWESQAAPWEDIGKYALQFHNGRDAQGQRTQDPGAMDAVMRALSTDANFSGMMQNSMGKYYGGANSLSEVAQWILNPTMNQNAAREYGGVW